VELILTTFVAAVALGIAGQIIAERFQLPAILPLLVLGILANSSCSSTSRSHYLQ
jgi:uncharacterized membrane protein YjjB (DUF3815 family)